MTAHRSNPVPIPEQLAADADFGDMVQCFPDTVVEKALFGQLNK